QRQQPLGKSRSLARRASAPALRVRQGTYFLQGQGDGYALLERYPDLQGRRPRRPVSDAARDVPARQGDAGAAGVLCRPVPEGDADARVQGLHGKAGAEADLPHRQGHAAIPRGRRRAKHRADDASGFCREVAGGRKAIFCSPSFETRRDAPLLRMRLDWWDDLMVRGRVSAVSGRCFASPGEPWATFHSEAEPYPAMRPSTLSISAFDNNGGVPICRQPWYCRARVSTSTASHIAFDRDGPTAIMP